MHDASHLETKGDAKSQGHKLSNTLYQILCQMATRLFFTDY